MRGEREGEREREGEEKRGRENLTVTFPAFAAGLKKKKIQNIKTKVCGKSSAMPTGNV